MPNPKPRMPESGLYNEDGYLFHHVSIRPLKLNEIERLREHGKLIVFLAGIPYQPRMRFTPAEDKQIRKNWRRFAAQNGLSYDMAPHYAGVPGYKVFSDNQEHLEFNRTTLLWQKLCHNLPHRSASQVQRRIGVLFDAAVLSGHTDIAYSKKVHWTLQETEKLLQHYKVNGLSTSSMQVIGKIMNRPAIACRNHLQSVLARAGPVPDFLRKKIWSVVMKHTPLSNGRKFEHIVYKDIRRERIKGCDQYDCDIPWDIVAQKMMFTIESVKDAWHRLLEDVQKLFNEKRHEGRSCEETWSTVLSSIFSTVPPISCEGFSGFLQILSDCTPDDTAYHLWSRKLYDCEFISTRLENEGIVGFYSGSRDELGYLLSKAQALLWKVNRLLFRHLKLQYSLKERIHILSLAYDYQFEFSPDSQPDSSEPLRYRYKHLNLKHCGFPALHRAPFVEALVVYSLNNFKDWIPPTALKNYVVCEDILSLFPAKKNNSELIRQSDLDAAVSFLDLDVGSEMSTSESDSDHSSGDGVGD